MDACGFISDGYSEPIFLAGKPGFYPPVRGEMRPALGEELDRYNADADKLKGPELRRHAAKFMAAHLASWDLKDAKGEAVAVGIPNLLRCKDALFLDLVAVMLGSKASDIDPRWTEAEKQQQREDEEAAAAEGMSLAEYRERRDRKN